VIRIYHLRTRREGNGREPKFYAAWLRERKREIERENTVMERDTTTI